MAIYYNILYPPLLPISHPGFELLRGKEDKFRIYLQPSVGNKISDFKGGFIRIRDAETEKSVLINLSDQEDDMKSKDFVDGFVPFRNPFAEYFDIVDKTKNVLQPSGYSKDMPKLEKDKNGKYYIELNQNVLEYAMPDKKYKVQIMLTTDWLSSSQDYGRGKMLRFDSEAGMPEDYDPEESGEFTGAYVPINTELYFSGNLVSKGLSEWSTNSTIAPMTKTNYFLQFSNRNNIFSPIFEFIGSSEDNVIYKNSPSKHLKAYRINIFRAFGAEKDIFVDSSDWIIGQEATNLEIRWQNVVELEDKRDYIVELDIQTAWDLRKTFVYNVSTMFEDSLFRGEVKAYNDHDYARAKIKLDIQTPLQWGPRENFSISSQNNDFSTVSGEGSVLEGIDFFNTLGAISGEMIMKNITPIKTWEEREDRWFFRLKGPDLTHINPIQEEYLIYAHSVPLGPINPYAPNAETLNINPVIEAPNGTTYNTYLDAKIKPFEKRRIEVDEEDLSRVGYLTIGKGIIESKEKNREFLAEEKVGGITTYPAGIPSSISFFYVEDDSRGLWRVTVNNEGEFITTYSHKKGSQDKFKKVAFFDPWSQILVVPNITEKGVLEYSYEVYYDYDLKKNLSPLYVNEFRFVKNVYGLELGRKTRISRQTYKAFLTDKNRKLGNWNPIAPHNEYYFYFEAKDGQLRLVVGDTSSTSDKNMLDRYSATYSYGESSDVYDPDSTQTFLATTGLNSDFTVSREGTDSIEIPYTVTIADDGSLIADKGFISSIATISTEYTKEEIEELKEKGEIE